jgi:hypothetical protein
MPPQNAIPVEQLYPGDPVAQRQERLGRSRPNGRNQRGQIKFEERERRLDLTMHLLGLGWRDARIKGALHEKFGISGRVSINYLNRAKQQLMRVTDMTREQHIDASYNVYRAIVADPDTTTKERIDAQKRIDELLGLEMPTKHQISYIDSMTEEQIRLEIARMTKEPVALEPRVVEIVPDNGMENRDEAAPELVPVTANPQSETQSRSQ